jgi:hypothetical protein
LGGRAFAPLALSSPLPPGYANDRRYECTPRRGNVLERGITLPGRSEVGTAGITPCRMQLCTALQSSTRPYYAACMRRQPKPHYCFPSRSLLLRSHMTSIVHKLCCKLTLIIPEEGLLPFSSVTFLKPKKTYILYYPIVRLTRRTYHPGDTFLRTPISVILLEEGTSLLSRLTMQIPGSEDIH